MPLQGSQVQAIASPVFRAHWPERSKLFVSVDDLLRTKGPTCSRLHAIWDLLLSPAVADLALWDWFTKVFPGVALRAGGGSYPRPDGKKPTEIQPRRRGSPPVMKAIDILQSYRKS